MMDYERRYLAGILFFNGQDYFEAHEAWEDLWADSHGQERKFYQGLIQAAVGLFHFGGGNLGGAVKLYRSSRDYMTPCGPNFLGLDLPAFWTQMEKCFSPLLTAAAPDRSLRPDPALLPHITLEPPPDSWPDPDDYVSADD
jgi:hypothetical protein